MEFTHLIQKLRQLRLFTADNISWLLCSQLDTKNPSKIHISEDLEELINIQDLMLPHVQNEATYLGVERDISEFFQKGDILQLIYYWFTSSPKLNTWVYSKYLPSSHSYLHSKIHQQLPEKSEQTTCSDLAKRLNRLLNNFGLLETEKAADYRENPKYETRFRLQDSILMTVNYMYQHFLITVEDYEEFFKNKNTLEIATVTFFFGPYGDKQPSHSKNYLSFPSKCLAHSISRDTGFYEDMDEVLDDEGRRRVTYGLLKLLFSLILASIMRQQHKILQREKLMMIWQPFQKNFHNWKSMVQFSTKTN